MGAVATAAGAARRGGSHGVAAKLACRLRWFRRRALLRRCRRISRQSSGSYGERAMYPPPVRGQASVGTAESGSAGVPSYSTNHDPSSQSGWQALYSDGPDIHFSASMLPPNARGYSAAPRESVSGVTPGATRNETRRLQSQWIARPEMDGISHHRHHLYGGVGRGYGEYFCGPFRGFGFCGGPFFYGFYDEGFGCGGGNYWGVSDGRALAARAEFCAVLRCELRAG